MRLFRSTQGALVLQLGRDEKPAFLELLGRYPVVPESHQKLSRSRMLGSADDHQQLLDDALHEQRVDLQSRVRRWLDEPGRFRRVKSGFNFTLLRTDADWLLRVLNDVRVGSWLQLGAPEEMPGPKELLRYHPAQLRAWLGMELSGKFQMELLFALEQASAR